MVDLKAAPFYLDTDQIKWVETTISRMTLEQKLKQLFVLLDGRRTIDENTIRETILDSGQGGLRWQGGDADEVYARNTAYQKHSEIPLLIACNCDEGGNGVVPEGTFVATAAQAAAGGSEETAFRMGLVAAREAASIGCNWMFNPIVDIYMNWRNTIVNTRCFGDNADDVIKNARAFIRGVKQGSSGMACCCKHFPGDGVEELDQHLVMGINPLDVESWFNSFGKVYKTLIDDGIESIMIGHIALPEMSRLLKPGIKDSEIMPATLAPELTTELLRNKLGFNGLVITDATHMIGFSAVMKRSESLPRVIACGSDMLLFSNSLPEDLGYLKKGVESGIISNERLNDALTRILGLKAKTGLNKPGSHLIEPEQKERWISCEEHRKYTIEEAVRCVTLVKDTQGIIPLNPKEKSNVLLVYAAEPLAGGPGAEFSTKNIVTEELERIGFKVDLCPSFYDLENKNGPSPLNMREMIVQGPRADFRKDYDVVFLVVNFRGYARENNLRVRWSCSHSKEIPWYISEIPTIGISLNFTNHLIDFPQLKTYINAYGQERENIRAVIEKICGKSDFHGVPSETVFCERWEARI